MARGWRGGGGGAGELKEKRVSMGYGCAVVAMTCITYSKLRRNSWEQVGESHCCGVVCVCV